MLVQVEIDAYRQADHSAATLLHSMQHEVKQAAAHADRLTLPKRSQFRKNMLSQWHPGELESLASATLATSYACCCCSGVRQVGYGHLTTLSDEIATSINCAFLDGMMCRQHSV